MPVVLPRALVLTLLSLLVLFAACRPEEKGKELRLGDLTFSDHGTREVKGRTMAELKADNFYFAPTFLRGEPGQKLRLEVENESGTVHNFSIAGQAGDQDIPGKKQGAG